MFQVTQCRVRGLNNIEKVILAQNTLCCLYTARLVHFADHQLILAQKVSCCLYTPIGNCISQIHSQCTLMLCKLTCESTHKQISFAFVLFDQNETLMLQVVFSVAGLSSS